MKSIVTEELSGQEKTDELLDKISKYGIISLTIHEKEFLDAVSLGDEEIVRTKMRILSTDTIFEDDYFKFELEDIKYEEDGIEYIGTLYVPDLEKSHKTIEGNLKGKIILYNTGVYSLEFLKVVSEKSKEVEYDVFEFCSGLEYELDSFIDYVVEELG